DDLQRFYEAKVQRGLFLSDEAQGEDYREVQALFNSPWLDGPRREALWLAGRKLGQKLTGKVQSLDKSEGTAKTTAMSSPPSDRRPGRALALARLRFQHAVDMIHLAEHAKTAAIEKDYQSALGKGDADAWAALAEKANDIWPRQMLGEFKASEQNL